MSQIDAIDFAREFARRAHGDQKYGDLPYIVHLEEVANIAATSDAIYQVGTNEERATLRRKLAIFGLLHDVIEDTAFTKTALGLLFGDYFANGVNLMSGTTLSVKRPRRIRAKRINQSLRQLNIHGTWWEVLVVKPADRLGNVRNCVKFGNESLLKMYRKEHGAFREAAFRSGLCDDIWEELDTLIAGKEVAVGT